MAETINSLEDLGTAAAVTAQPAAPVHVQKLDAQGRAIVPDRPGWGFDFDPAVIKKYSAA